MCKYSKLFHNDWEACVLDRYPVMQPYLASSLRWTKFHEYFRSKVNILTVRGQQHSFSRHERMFLWMCFWDRECLFLRGTRNPNLRIQTECSNYLSYQGPTITSALCLNTGSGSVDILQVKWTFEMLAVCRQQHSFSTHERMFLWSVNYIYYTSWSHISIKLNIR